MTANIFTGAGTANTQVTGVDAGGDTFRVYADVSGAHGFIDIKGAITPIDFAGAYGSTFVTGADAAGDAFGYYRDSSGYAHGSVDSNGTITLIDVAGATKTVPRQIT
jgi:hypothetical protein